MGRQKAKEKGQKARVPSRGSCLDAIGMPGTRLIIAFILLPFACHVAAVSSSAAQKVIDQIVALVNDDVITRSDLLWSLAMDPDSPNPAEGVSSDLLRQKLDVFIDQRLIAQEARRIPTSEISADEVSKYLKQLIGRFKTDQAFHERVDAVGLTPDRIGELIRERILIERFVDFRFRSFVFVTEAEIQRYYDEDFAPRVRGRGLVPPSLDAKLPKAKDSEKELTVRESITEIIRRSKIDEEIDRFLNAVRQRADITILTEP